MNDTANNVIDARLSEALGTYFNGVTLLKTVGDCAILSGVRKQNGAPVSIYTPSFSVARDEAIAADIGKAFAIYDRIGSPRLQATERLLTSRIFRKTPALAVLSCPVPVFDEAFDTLPLDSRLALFDQVLEGLAALHGAGLVHGNLSPDVVRRETDGGTPRLTELTFSGDRSTTVTGQPTAYQSRHVINTTQPRPEDDVHAAGMLGYRILLGPDGPSRALGIAAGNPEEAIAAILGDHGEAPGAEDLFPDGHPKAEQISRLLARMTSRLPNAAPYSGADAARRAFQTVLSGQGVPDPVPVATAAASAHPLMTAVPSARSGGVSPATALTLFAGFLVSTAAACYFYLGNNAAVAARDAAFLQLERETARFAEIDTARAALRQADRALATGLASGATLASADASSALAEAKAALELADDTIAEDPAGAAEIAGQAETQADTALSLVVQVRDAAKQALSEAGVMAAAARLAAGNADLSDENALNQAAAEFFEVGRFEEAALGWSVAASAFAGISEEWKSAAEAARTRFDGASTGSDGAGAVLARSYSSRGGAAYDDGRFAEAVQLYDAALAALGATREVQTQTADEVRTVTIGDSSEALAAAVRLCLDAAPIDTANCPSSRREDEAARSAQITPYELDRTEVSAAEFRRFVEETGHRTEAETSGRIVALTSSGEARLIDGGYTWATPGGAGSVIDDAPDRPVTNIALSDARAYCTWAGGRLPSEAEWEAAARTGAVAAFPWGAWAADAPIWRGSPTPARRLPTPVEEAGGESAGGHVGLSGNVREWVLGQDGAVLKGGSWNTANPADLRISARLIVPDNAPGVDFGFRCARDLEAWP